MKLTFNTENERKGAEIILDNVIASLKPKWHSKKSNGLELEYENVPEIAFTIAQNHTDWAFIEKIGQFKSLGEYYETITPRFESAEDKDAEVTAIKTELNELIK